MRALLALALVFALAVLAARAWPQVYEVLGAVEAGAATRLLALG